MMDEAEREYRWQCRPMRGMTTPEVKRQLEDREKALSLATTAIARQMVEIAIQRLREELEGRETRKQFSGSFEDALRRAQ